VVEELCDVGNVGLCQLYDLQLGSYCTYWGKVVPCESFRRQD
jgi:hypothetical protein